MNKPQQFEAMPAITKQSLDAMSQAFSGWVKNANRLQAEALRFLNDRFNTDVEMMSQVAHCKKPAEFFSLQAKLASTLVSDYTKESSRIIALLGDVAKDGAAEFSKVAAGKHGA